MKHLLLFISIVACISCSQKSATEPITLIPHSEYLYYYKGNPLKFENVDSIRLSGVSDFDMKKLNSAISPYKNSKYPIVIKYAASRAGWASHAAALIDILEKEKIEYIVEDTMTMSEKQRFGTSDARDMVRFMTEPLDIERAPDPSIDGKALIFFISNDGSIRYKISPDYSQDSSALVKPKTVENIKTIITSAEGVFKKENTKMNVFLRADGNSTYSLFAQLFDALKEKGISNYRYIVDNK